MTTKINTGGNVDFIYNDNYEHPQFTKEESEEIDRLFEKARKRKEKERIKRELEQQKKLFFNKKEEPKQISYNSRKEKIKENILLIVILGVVVLALLLKYKGVI